jgi:hypothetical protein
MTYSLGPTRKIVANGRSGVVFGGFWSEKVCSPSRLYESSWDNPVQNVAHGGIRRLVCVFLFSVSYVVNGASTTTERESGEAPILRSSCAPGRASAERGGRSLIPFPDQP